MARQDRGRGCEVRALLLASEHAGAEPLLVTLALRLRLLERAQRQWLGLVVGRAQPEQLEFIVERSRPERLEPKPRFVERQLRLLRQPAQRIALVRH